jgi:endonuclease/exonuclease/phosphatase family metal-dependent hydrolase
MGSSGVRVTTLNLLNKNVRHAASFPSWPERAKAIAALINEMDVIATQEGVPSMINELDQLTPDHRYVGIPRSPDPEVGEMSAVFFDDRRFDLVDHGDFWLSDSPATPASVGWDAATARIATWVRLRDVDGRLLTVLSTHFDHAGAEARVRSAELVAAMVRRQNGGVVVAGDLNATPTSQPLLTLQALLDDARSVSHAPPKGHAHTHGGGERIDYVLVSSELQVRTYEVRQVLTADGQPASDHAAVVVELERR